MDRSRVVLTVLTAAGLSQSCHGSKPTTADAAADAVASNALDTVDAATALADPPMHHADMVSHASGAYGEPGRRR